MTKTEVLAMPAGKGMDLLIADKVMGWGTWKFWEGRSMYWWSNWEAGTFGKYKGPIPHVSEWFPSTDIHDAWMVAERSGLLEETRLTCLEGLWVIAEHNGDHVARADTAPLAICRAALLSTLEGK